MAYEQLKNATLPRTLSDVFAGLADLFQKEMRLARAEVTSILSAKLEAGIWMVAQAHSVSSPCFCSSKPPSSPSRAMASHCIGPAWS